VLHAVTATLFAQLATVSR